MFVKKYFINITRRKIESIKIIIKFFLNRVKRLLRKYTIFVKFFLPFRKAISDKTETLLRV